MPEQKAARGSDGSRGLTTRGRCLFAGGAAAVVCAILLDERDLLRVGLIAVAVPLIAVVLTASKRVKLEASHQVFPERLRPGNTGHVMLTVTNAGTVRSHALEVVEDAAPDLTPGLHCMLPGLKRGRAAQAGYRLNATRRGRFILGPPKIRVADPFGLWEDTRTLPARSEVLVVPTVVPLVGMPASAGARSAASGRAAIGTGGGDPDVGIRAYRNGDDIRTIHWRASARHDELMVRLEEPVSHGGVAVLLDHRAGAHRGSGAWASLETAVTLAASVSLHLLASDNEVRLVSHSGAVITEGHDIADDVLAELAVVEADRAELVTPSMGNAGLLVAVLGELSAADARLLAASRQRRTRAIALLLATEEWDPAGGPAGTATAMGVLSANGWRVAAVHPRDNLADCWRQVCTADAYAAGMRRIS